MPVTAFDPNTSMEGITIFPARLAIPNVDSSTRYKYMRTYRLGFYVRPISCMFDKVSNRIKLTVDLIPRDIRNADTGERTQAQPIRSSFDVKLDIPRGSLSSQKMTHYKIVEMPDYWGCSNRPAGKLKAADDTEICVSSDKLRHQCYKAVYDILFNDFNTHGCPAEVDRRKLPELLKNYTGELREKWRIQQHAFEYPANQLATILADKLSGRRGDALTLEQLIEWHLISDYPQLTLLSARSKTWDCMRQTQFLGMYSDTSLKQGGNTQIQTTIGCNTKNAQLALKLSNLLGTQISLHDLDKAFEDFSKRQPNSSTEIPWITFAGLNSTRVYFVGATKTIQRQESR